MLQPYATQCDRLRRSPEGEQTWIALVSRAEAISQEEFEKACNLSDLLNDGETLEDFVSPDPQHTFYKVRDDAGHDVHFIQHSGFEFFFAEEGQWPPQVRPTDLELVIHGEYSRDALAMVILGPNDPRIIGAPHHEREVDRRGNLRVIQGGEPGEHHSHYRFILDTEQGPAAGIRVTSDGGIDQIYTRQEFRRQGLASALVQHARELLGDVQMDSSRTADGQAFWQAFYAEPEHAVDLSND